MVRSKKFLCVSAVGAALALGIVLGAAGPTVPEVRGWIQGKGWGWTWGKEDEAGALNGLSDALRLRALREATSGKVYDLGVPYDRRSFKWPGHNPAEIITFRSP